jgi:hypothetical protein
MTPTDNDILMMMEMTARAEREAGFTGYGKPPEEVREACERLVDAGLAEEHKFQPGWFRPTKKGTELVAPRIHRAQ